MTSSVRGQRLLAELGVAKALDEGESLVLRGPLYEHRKQPGALIQLAFVRDEEGRIAVGYALRDGDGWSVVEHEPFSLRAIGYYQRRLKRLGDRVGEKDRETPW
jgi:hypothetical protein